MRLKLYAAAALLALTATAASAEVVTVTYTGTVTGGTDTDGLFGPVNANLAGDAYTVVYTVNTALGTYSTDGSTYSAVTGGYPVSVAVTGAITIDGHTFDVDGSESDYDDDESSGAQVSTYTFSTESGLGAVITNDVTSATPFTTYDLTKPFYYAPASGDYAAGAFEDFGSVVELDYLSESSVTVAAVSGVPEAASWTLMLAGFAALGAALRRRSKLARLPQG